MRSTVIYPDMAFRTEPMSICLFGSLGSLWMTRLSHL
jgi:hypothetical protein